MERTVYRVLARVVAVVLLLVGIGATWGGTWAHGYVRNQLASQQITMPEGAALASDDMKATLTQYAGTPLDSGPKAEAFANHYILAHMNASSDGQTYSQVSSQYMQLANDPAADQAEVQRLADLRQSLFMGSSLRGMLLTAYAWSVVATIALWVGIGALVVAVILAVLGWYVLRAKPTEQA